ncbi:hypothetical protein SORBI_3003G288500 [Sorghum bicolor]|uniref:Uncharacterized protein n=1 Tax=Sorghum bicolor TaxID=4558 RepID=A0A1B6Q5X6_SORBI|nr:hypothetical protein SORBI_3003G288500 [Sorghum bicolor]
MILLQLKQSESKDLMREQEHKHEHDYTQPGAEAGKGVWGICCWELGMCGCSGRERCGANHNSVTIQKFRLVSPSPSRCSIVVSIPACHAGDPGSIPGNGVYFFLLATVTFTLWFFLSHIFQKAYVFHIQA